MNRKILTAMLIAVCLCLAAGAVYAQDNALEMPQSGGLDWWEIVTTFCTVVLVPVLGLLWRTWQSERGKRLTLKILTAVIEEIEPSGERVSEQKIKPLIESEMKKIGQYELLDADVNKAKGAT
jgi:hypothetical protein